GSAIFGILDELTTRYTERVELVIGVILILVILFAPMGFVGFCRIVKEKWSSRRSSRATMEVNS
ncbi:MAG: hypothetical protein MUO68_23990, partial [Desulfobacteraceae bacterium]|nr:hypothetical protein [Desulfobacteraceae bacterium]